MQQHFSLLCARLVHSLNDNNDDPDPCLLVCSTAALFHDACVSSSMQPGFYCFNGAKN